MLGFVVKPGSSSDVLRAIEIASSLWGGAFFPIIPLLKRITGPIRHQVPRRITAEQMVAGYVDAFDPDVLVKIGNLTIPKELANSRQVIEADEVLSNFSDDHTPKWGIGAPEFLARFARDELKYVRDPPINIIFPKPTRRHRMFLGSVFGALPKEVADAVRIVMPARNLRHPPCSIDNFFEFMGAETLFPRRLLNLDLRLRRSESCVFLIDALNADDVIDYWNLRAAGWMVLPIPRQVCMNAGALSLARQFIDGNYWEYRHSPGFYHSTNVMKGRTVPPADLVRFINGLSLAPPKGNNARIVIRPNYPRIWDEWAREKDQVDVERLYAAESDTDISEDAKSLDFTPIAPKFVSRFGGHGTPRFVNDVEVRFYGGTELYAEVIPSGSSSLARAISSLGFREWRFSNSGLSLLCEHPGFKAFLSPPLAERVFSEWLRTKGLEVELSDKGHIARQMLRQLGGVRRSGVLASRGLINLLRRMTTRAASDNRPGADPDASLEPSGKVLPAATFLAEVRKFASQEGIPKVDDHVRRLLDFQMFRLGLRIQCSICRQRWWQSLKELDYQVSCPNCFQRFSVASWVPGDFEWAFRTVGPFSLPDSAFGVYAVLLTYRFFSVLLHGAATPLLSCNLRKAGVERECDLALLFELLQYGRRHRDLIFVECKTFNEITKRDVTRLEELGDDFPGAVLVFATLRDSFSEPEQKLLRPLVNRSRKYWKSEKPLHPVIILTGNELFADESPPRSWESLGGKHTGFKSRYEIGHNLVDLADATQQLYLGLPPWREWLRKRSKKRPVPGPTQTQGEPDESLVITTPVHIALRQVESRDWPGS